MFSRRSTSHWSLASMAHSNPTTTDWGMASSRSVAADGVTGNPRSANDTSANDGASASRRSEPSTLDMDVSLRVSGRELAGRTAFAGRAAVGLCDLQPVPGLRPGSGDVQVQVVAAPGDQQTEVNGRSGHLLTGQLGPERPQSPGRRGDLEPELGIRRRQIP